MGLWVKMYIDQKFINYNRFEINLGTWQLQGILGWIILKTEYSPLL